MSEPRPGRERWRLLVDDHGDAWTLTGVPYAAYAGERVIEVMPVSEHENVWRNSVQTLNEMQGDLDKARDLLRRIGEAFRDHSADIPDVERAICEEIDARLQESG